MGPPFTPFAQRVRSALKAPTEPALKALLREAIAIGDEEAEAALREAMAALPAKGSKGSTASGGHAPKTAPVPSARSAGGGQPLSVPGGAVPDAPEPASADPVTVEGADGRVVKHPTRKDHGSPVAVPVRASVSLEDWQAALAQRDAALSRLKVEYPAMCAQMRDLIAEVTAADAAVRAVNSALPEGSPPIAAVQSRLRADVGAHRHASRPPDISKDVRMPSLLHNHKSAGWAVRSLIAQETYDG